MKIIESPREGMQGLSHIISTDDKVRYINRLLRAGFDTIEIGSIVSSRLIPQMADTVEVIKRLDLSGQTANRMFLAVNLRGAELLASMDEVTHISYPFSFSPTFLKLNMHASVEDSLDTAGKIIRLCEKSGKKAVIYISMAFGNPYDEPWSADTLLYWVKVLHGAGATTIPLSNVSIEISAELIGTVYEALIPMFPGIEFGLHLHTSNMAWYDKVEAAWNSGCHRYDGVINGWGGCPMAGNRLLGNLKTENILSFAEHKRVSLQINNAELDEAFSIAAGIFYNNDLT